MSVRRAGDRREVERRTGRKTAFLERRDMVVRVKYGGRCRSLRSVFRGLVSFPLSPRSPWHLSCNQQATMSALRLVSSVARRAPRPFVLGRRGYAEVADKIKLSLVLPHQVRLHTLTEPAELSVTPMRGRRSSPQQTLCRSTCRRPRVTWVFLRTMSRLLNRSGLAS